MTSTRWHPFDKMSQESREGGFAGPIEPAKTDRRSARTRPKKQFHRLDPVEWNQICACTLLQLRCCPKAHLLRKSLIFSPPLASLYGQNSKAFFWIGLRGSVRTPTHIAFAAYDRSAVSAFHAAALAAGGRCNGAPGLRPRYHANYFGAFVLDPDGHNIEAVCHQANCVDRSLHGAAHRIHFVPCSRLR